MESMFLTTTGNGIKISQNFISPKKNAVERLSKPIVCRFCLIKFCSRSEYRKHQKNCFHCPVNSTLTWNVDKLELEIGSHGQQDTSMDMMTTPTPISKGGRGNEHQNIFKCLCCTYETFEWREIERHVIDFHILHLPFSCHLCPFRAASLHSLDLHIMTHAEKRDQNQFDILKEFKASQEMLKLALNDWEVSQSQIPHSTKEKVKGHDLCVESRPSVIVHKFSSKQEKMSESSPIKCHQVSIEPIVNNVDVSDPVKLYNCPFCEFSTENQKSFASHFNSHSLILPSRGQPAAIKFY